MACAFDFPQNMFEKQSLETIINELTCEVIAAHLMSEKRTVKERRATVAENLSKAIIIEACQEALATTEVEDDNKLFLSYSKEKRDTGIDFPDFPINAPLIADDAPWPDALVVKDEELLSLSAAASSVCSRSASDHEHLLDYAIATNGSTDNEDKDNDSDQSSQVSWSDDEEEVSVEKVVKQNDQESDDRIHDDSSQVSWSDGDEDEAVDEDEDEDLDDFDYSSFKKDERPKNSNSNKSSSLIPYLQLSIYLLILYLGLEKVAFPALKLTLTHGAVLFSNICILLTIHQQLLSANVKSKLE